MCTCCSAYWHLEFKTWFNDQDVVKVYPDKTSVIKVEFQDDVNEKINNMWSKLSYTGDCKRNDHSFG